MKNDIDNGDMTVDILVKFHENELSNIANEYKLSTLQKKAFIEAVKLLPNSKANVNSTSNNKNKEFVFVTPEEQSILNEMTQLKKDLNHFSKQCANVKRENKNVILSNTTKVKNCAQLIKQCVDDTVNSLVKQVSNCNVDGFVCLRSFNFKFCFLKCVLLVFVTG